MCDEGNDEVTTTTTTTNIMTMTTMITATMMITTTFIAMMTITTTMTTTVMLHRFCHSPVTLAEFIERTVAKPSHASLSEGICGKTQLIVVGKAEPRTPITGQS